MGLEKGRGRHVSSAACAWDKGEIQRFVVSSRSNRGHRVLCARRGHILERSREPRKSYVPATSARRA